MALAQSKLTSQGQISVPLEVRRKLGLGPGSILEWQEEGGVVVVRRAGRFTSADIHRALFLEQKPEPHTTGQLTEGLREHARRRHARR